MKDAWVTINDLMQAKNKLKARMASLALVKAEIYDQEVLVNTLYAKGLEYQKKFLITLKGN